MTETYSAKRRPTTPDRKAKQTHERRASKGRREAVEALNAMKELRIRRLVARAYRSEKVLTKDGRSRRYRFRANVSAMAARLLWYEGKGELPHGWIYKSAAEWEEETGLTERMQWTARRVALAEGLWQENEHTRRDGRTVVAYRLDVWRLWQIVNRAEIDAAKEKLEHVHDPARRAELKKEVRERERTGCILAVADTPDAEGSEAEPDGDEAAGAADSKVQVHGHARPSDIVSPDPPQNDPPAREHPKSLKETACKQATKKSPEACSLPVSGQKIKKHVTLSDEEAERRWEALVENSAHGPALTSLASLMAEHNVTKQVAISRVWRTLGSRFIHWTSKLDLSEDAWAHGLWAALVAGAPSIGYARKAAQSHDRREGR